MITIASGVSRISPAQALELGSMIINSPHVPTVNKLSIKLDLVDVDGNEVLRVRYNDTGVTISASGAVRALPADEAPELENGPFGVDDGDEPAAVLPDTE